jgi:signal peptidase II
VACAAFALDQATKVWAVANLAPGESKPLLGDLLQLTLTRNPGAAFSTATGATQVLSVVAIVAFVTVIVLSRRIASPLWAVGMGSLLAGISGNLTDRLLRAPGPFRGHVIDFLQLPHWPIFNVADICINIAAGVIILQAIRGIGLDGERQPAEAPA